MSLSCLKISIDSPSPTGYSLRFLSVAENSLPSEPSQPPQMSTRVLHTTTYDNTPPQTVTQGRLLLTPWEDRAFGGSLPLGTCMCSAFIPLPFILSLGRSVSNTITCVVPPQPPPAELAPLPIRANYSLFFLISPPISLIKCMLVFLTLTSKALNFLFPGSLSPVLYFGLV